MMIWRLAWIFPSSLLLLSSYLWVNNPPTSLNPLTAKTSKMEWWELVPGSVYDGDTLKVTRGGVTEKIRLCGIDAPEKRQPLGIKSRDYLRQLLARGGGKIGVIPVERDAYQRLVAEMLVVVEGQSIHLNAEMVGAGMAYHYQQYSGKCPNRKAISRAEEKAVAEGLGVWDGSNYQKPWDYRKGQR